MLQKQQDGFESLFQEKKNVFESFLKVFEGNKKNYEIVNSIISFLNEHDNFSRLEVKNKLSNNFTLMKDEFSFNKGKKEINNHINDKTNENDKNLINIFEKPNNVIEYDNKPKILEMEGKKCFSFIKTSAKANNGVSSKNVNIINPLVIQSDIINKYDPNILKVEIKQKSQHSSKLLDLDKLYSEYTETNTNCGGNVSNHSINFHQNYHLDLSDFNLKNPVVNDIIPQSDKWKNLEKENGKNIKTVIDHFGFVNDMMKKKL